MVDSLQKNALAGVLSLHAYTPGMPIDELQRRLGIKDVLKLASNENPLGASPKVRAALADAVAQQNLGLYPDGSGHSLKAAIGRYHDIDPARITLGNGSNDILEFLSRIYAGPGRAVMYSDFAFAVYSIAAQAQNAESVVVPAYPADHPTMPYGHDLEAFTRVLKTRPDVSLVFIANPNNPTGTWNTPQEIEGFLDTVPPQVIVALDEAYFDYQDTALRSNARVWLDRYPNLLVCRTFSKIYGIAGLRAGYALSHPTVADLLNRVRQPFNNNTLALLAAELALADQDHVQRSIELNARERLRVPPLLKALGLKTLPSQANFLTIDFARDAAPIHQGLLERGIIVRPMGSYGLPNFLRVTLGTESENDRFLGALREVLGSQVPERLLARHLAVIGLGLIGGSLARSLHDSGLVGRISGYDHDPERRRQAVELKVIDEAFDDAHSAVAEADLVVVAVPVLRTAEAFAAIRDGLAPGAVVTDVGSTKQSVVADVISVFGELPSWFVPGHPIAGTEKSGVAHSLPNLFRDHRVILTPHTAQDPAALTLVEAMWTATGARVVRMSPEQHDAIFAATSHLPHLLAFSFVDMLAQSDRREEVFPNAGGGFRDFTRIASSSPQMWHDIVRANAPAVNELLGRQIADLQAMQQMIEQGQWDALKAIFERARAAREHYLTQIE